MSLKTYSRDLRRQQTHVEKILWRHLRGRECLHCKFRRQHPIGRYIFDFVCLKINLVIELDGGQHAWKNIDDRKRTKYLNIRGFDVIRYWNDQVALHLHEVLEDIYREVRKRL